MAKQTVKSPAELQDELRQLAQPHGDAKPPLDMKKAALRVGAVVALLWALALGVQSWTHSKWPLLVVAVLTAAVVGIGFWAYRYITKSQALGAILKEADSAESRREALKKLEGFKKDDVQAALARAQLEMQEDPRKALATLEVVDLGRQLGPVADQVRSMRAMLHLTLGEAQEARGLVDVLELGKQQDAKTRAMFATVAGEAWARTGAGKKAVETLELFNPEDPTFAEMRVQMWRARAFAYAAVNDMKGAGRALRKLADLSPQLLGMFIGQKKIHPLLEKEAKQVLQKSGAMPRRMVQRRI